MPEARRPRPVRHAQVQEVLQLTPHLVRVVVSGDGLAGFDVGEFSDHYVKLQLPPPGASYAAPFEMEDIRERLPRDQWPRVRTYTVRDWDAQARRLTIDFVVHGDSGVAGPWAAAATPGQTLQFMGPGGAYSPDPAVDWHLMIGDTAVIPAIAMSLERVPEGVPVRALIQVDGPDDELGLASPGDLELSWVHDPPGSCQALLDALTNLAFPEGRAHVFLHGEATMVRSARRHLLTERGLPREALSVSGYWKLSRDEEGWREDKAEWNRQVEADLG